MYLTIRNNILHAIYIEIIYCYRSKSRGGSQSANSYIQSTTYRFVRYYLERGRLGSCNLWRYQLCTVKQFCTATSYNGRRSKFHTRIHSVDKPLVSRSHTIFEERYAMRIYIIDKSIIGFYINKLYILRYIFDKFSYFYISYH